MSACDVDDSDIDVDYIRDELAEVKDRHDIGLDGRRPDAVEKRRSREQRTARENIADLVTWSPTSNTALSLLLPREREDLSKTSFSIPLQME